MTGPTPTRSIAVASNGEAHQSLHGAVQSMSVVSSELGVGSLERGVSGGLGLLDTAARNTISKDVQLSSRCTRDCRMLSGDVGAYPLR